MPKTFKKRRSFFYRNGLSVFLFFCFFVFLGGQTCAGWMEHNNALLEHNVPQLSFISYLGTGHFVQATFENWESEFLQMFLYVLVTVWLRQQGSAESKDLEKPESVDRNPTPDPDAPWPVRKGGLVLSLYKNSLSLAFFILFAVSFCLHAWGSYDNYVDEQALKGMSPEKFSHYISGSRFWFESFQNWQSEFLAIGSIVILSVFFRQFGSPESKPVDAPHSSNS